MPTVRTTTGTHIDASPEDVFNFVSDLSNHGDWAANADLEVEAVSEGPVAVGSEYRSTVQFMGSEVKTEIRVTALESPSRFSFTVKESDSDHDHEFTFQAEDGGTRVQRKTAHHLPLVKSIMFTLIGGPFIAKPAHKKAYAALKEKLESGGS